MKSRIVETAAFSRKRTLLIRLGLAALVFGAPFAASGATSDEDERANVDQQKKLSESDVRRKVMQTIREGVVRKPSEALSMKQLEPLVKNGPSFFREDKPLVSVKAREILPGLLYGSQSATQNMDLYLPFSEEPAPTIILIHGGAFLWGTARGIFDSMIAYFVPRGYAVATINYRLGGEAKFPRAVNDVKAAIRFLRANAKKYDLDPNRFAVGGESAGGYLAAMAGLTGNIGFLDGDNTENRNVSSAVRIVFDWYGPIDFIAMQEQIKKDIPNPPNFSSPTGELPEEVFLGAKMHANPFMSAICNPENYIAFLDPKTAPVFLIQHGEADRIVPVTQSKIFAKKLKKRIGAKKTILDLIPNQDHGAPAIYSELNYEKMHELMQRVFKTKK